MSRKRFRNKVIRFVATLLVGLAAAVAADRYRCARELVSLALPVCPAGFSSLSSDGPATP
ncbi:MAG: hypothetical protein ACQESR_04500 [Planctomycetota bacterium]